MAPPSTRQASQLCRPRKNQKDVFTRTFKSLRDKHHAVAARDETVWAVRSATERDKAATGLRQGATASDGEAG
jgi:hypothetical protein